MADKNAAKNRAEKRRAAKVARRLRRRGILVAIRGHDKSATRNNGKPPRYSQADATR